MPKIQVTEGIELFYEELGSGDRYVLSLQMDFPPVHSIRELAKYGYHVFLITNRGMGQSTHVFEDYANEWYNLFADDVVAFADRMGIEKFVYCGCSHGAGTGWHIMLRHPERVTAFIAIVGGPHNIDEGTWSYKARVQAGEKMKPMDPDTDDEAIKRRNAKNAVYSRALQQTRTPEEKALDYRRPLLGYETEANVQAALRTIQTPTLMIGGLEDPISRPDLMLRTAQCLPHGKLVLYAGFGHGGPCSQIVEEVAEEALNFLRNVERTGRVYKEVIEE